jgi:hypothetical protein
MTINRNLGSLADGVSTSGVLDIANGGTGSTNAANALVALGGANITSVQDNQFNFGVDTGVANAYVVALNPVITSYTDGMIVSFNALNANTGSSTLNAGGGAKIIFGLFPDSLQGGEIAGGGNRVIVQFVAAADAGAGGWLLVSSVGGSLQIDTAKTSIQAPQSQQTVGGIGTSYVNQTANRSIGTTFTNSTGGAIAVGVISVSASIASQTFSAIVDTFTVYVSPEIANGSTSVISVYFIVPSGASYEVTCNTGTAPSFTWVELVA